MSTRISPAQRNVLHSLTVNLLKWDSDLTEFQRKPYIALQSKGLIKLTTDDNGHNYWELV
jgi:hypothetical protein